MKIAKLCEAHKDVQAYEEPFEIVIGKHNCIICGREKWHQRIKSMSPETKKEYLRKKNIRAKLRKQQLQAEQNHPLDIEQIPPIIEPVILDNEAQERKQTLFELKRELRRVKNLRIRLQEENKLVEFEKKEKKRIASREHKVTEVERLSDSYVKQKFIQGYGGKANLIAKDIPQELVDTYRDLIQFKRILKKQKES